ncbi:hypothetical protein CBL_11826 [Carabus blaptoides fortunei]
MASSSQIVIKNIEELICILDNNFENNRTVLDQIVSDIAKGPTPISSFITYINSQLSNAPTRQKGLSLLKTLCPLCPSASIAEHAIAWLNNSLKYPEKEVIISDDAFTIINFLVETCHEVPELSKSVTSGILNKIVEQICKTQNSLSSLKCLETCLRVYSGPCTPLRNTIDKYLIAYVDCSVSSDSVRFAGKCLHALQQVGGGGANGINHKVAWKKQQRALCATAHSLMDQLFESLTEFGNFQQGDNTPLQLPNLADGDSMKLNTTRLINIVIFLQEMLLGAYPTAKSVMPKHILDVVSRGLAITSAILGNQIISETISLSMYLNLIHRHCLQLLQALIVSLGCNLIPYATVICKLIANNLKSMTPKDAANVQSFCELRVTAYQTLSIWMTVAKSASCVHVFADSIIPMIITDITPAKNEVNLSVQSSAPKHMTKKARKKLQQEQITQSSLAKSFSPITKKSSVSTNVYESKICSEALYTLQYILINIGYLLKPLIHKQLQEFVVKTLFDIQRGIVSNPYDDTTYSEVPSNPMESEVENTEKDKGKENQIESTPQEEKNDTSNEKLTNESVPQKEIMEIDTNTDKTEEKDSNKINADEIIEIPELNDTQANEKRSEKVSSTEHENSSKTSYSVHIEILSDDEVMERLTIDDEPENLNNLPEKQNAVSSTQETHVAKKKDNTENVIDLVEEDMCSAFVDIVNE